jgi:hypothetical protein
MSYPQWDTDMTYVNRTLDCIRFLATNLTGLIDVIELLNEPAAFWSDTFKQVLSQYWQDGYNVVREAAGKGVQVMIGDGFLGLNVSVSRFGLGASVQYILTTCCL